jgi:hypothetical protein
VENGKFIETVGEAIQSPQTRCGCGYFRDVYNFDEFLDPNEFWRAIRQSRGSDADRYGTPLVVSAVFTYGFAAGAQTCDGDRNLQNEIRFSVPGFGDELTVEVHEGFQSCYRCETFNEIGKRNLDVRALGVQFPSKFLQDRGEGDEGDFAVMLRQGLHKSTHMSSLELLWQVYRKRKSGDCVLFGILAVQNNDRVFHVGLAAEFLLAATGAVNRARGKSSWLPEPLPSHHALQIAGKRKRNGDGHS